MDWKTVYGIVNIYKSKHIVTYGGGPEGGYVYKERDPGWYRWRRTWFQSPAYTKMLTGQVVAKSTKEDVNTSGFSRTPGSPHLPGS